VPGAGTLHALVLQEATSNVAPGQSSPPFEGAGLLQVRLLAFLPPPQVCVQSPYDPQLPHTPLTTVYKYSVLFLLFYSFYRE